MPRIKLVDIDNRLSTKYNTIDGIHNWGEDNAYPQLIKSIINSSVTAKQCADLNSKYIYGKGFEFTKSITDKSTLIINKKGITVNQLLRIVSKEFAEMNNIFIHVNYNALYEITSLDLLDSTDVRIGKKDSTGYAGKFVVYDNWDKTKGKRIEKKDFTIIDRFNPNPTIIDLQVEAAGGWNKYNGQILHVNSSLTDLYSLPDVDSVIYDADSEFQVAVFKNNGLRKGFYGSHLFITKPFKDNYERQDFENTVKDLQGSTGVLVLEADESIDDLEGQMIVKNLETNIKDEMFSNTEATVSTNIIKAFGIPSILVNQNNDSSIFGNSGELLTQAQLMHWQDKEEERNQIQETFEMLFSRFHTQINPSNDWSITPIITKPTPATNE
jgi:hypothetical protein